MNTITTNNPSQSTAVTPNQAHGAKSYGTPSNIKSLGGDAALANWYEQAQSYYQSVIQGQEAAPDQYAWYDFLDQLSWAENQLGLHGSSWTGDSLGGDIQWDDAQGIGTTPGTPQDPFGGILGPHGSWVHTDVSTDLDYRGGEARDIWSNEVTINIPSLAAQVTATYTTDTRTDPAEEVLKIIVKDPATGMESVYYIHDYADATVNVNVPVLDQVNDQTGSLVIGEYDPDSPDNRVEASIEGELIDAATNHYLYEGRMGENLDFWPERGREGIFEVYGDANIYLRPSDQVLVEAAPAGSEYDYVLKVQHRDGSVDTFYLREEFKTNIHAIEEYVTFNIEGTETVGEVPTELRDIFSITNGGSEDDNTVGAAGDTAPDEVDGSTAHYNQSENVEVTANFEDGISTHMITAPGTVTIHKSSYADTVSIWDNQDGTYTVVVKKDGSDQDVETYIIKGADRIVLDFLDENISGDAMDADIVDIGTGDSGPGSTDLNLPQNLQDLGDFLNLSDEEVLAAIRRAYPHAPTREEDLLAWLQPPTFPTLNPDKDLMNLLLEIDPLLKANLYSLRGKNVGHADGKAIMEQVQGRMVELLKTIYPDQADSIETQEVRKESGGNITRTYYQYGIEFNGRFFHFWSSLNSSVFPEDWEEEDFTWL